MSTWEDETLIEHIRADGVYDYVHESWLYQIARRSGIEDPSQLRTLSIGLITEVLARGLMVAGDYGESHQPWDCSTGEAIVRIIERWTEWGDARWRRVPPRDAGIARMR